MLDHEDGITIMDRGGTSGHGVHHVQISGIIRRREGDKERFSVGGITDFLLSMINPNGAIQGI